MICVAWQRFPQYAARIVASFVKSTKEEVVVVATCPSVPIKGMDELAGCKVIWIESNDGRTIKELVGEIPGIILTSGWSVPAFRRYAKTVRKNGGLAFSMVDTNYRISVKDFLRNIRFRLFQRGLFDGFMVPGKSGVKLLKSYGVSDRYLARGMYSSDASLFKSDTLITDRPKRIVYVGQLCERKNILNFCKAFLQSKASEQGWSLAIYGSGSLKSDLMKFSNSNSAIEVNDFLQPEQLAAVCQSARALVLPSYSEPWGLVVHEAALSGCFLLLSNAVGASDDFLSEKNGLSFNPKSDSAMIDTINRFVALDDESLVEAQKVSIEKGLSITVEDYGKAVKYLASANGVKVE